MTMAIREVQTAAIQIVAQKFIRNRSTSIAEMKAPMASRPAWPKFHWPVLSMARTPSAATDAMNMRIATCR